MEWKEGMDGMDWRSVQDHTNRRTRQGRRPPMPRDKPTRVVHGLGAQRTRQQLRDVDVPGATNRRSTLHGVGHHPRPSRWQVAVHRRRAGEDAPRQAVQADPAQQCARPLASLVRRRHQDTARRVLRDGAGLAA